MASIKISELRPVGSELFQDSETFLNELNAQEMGGVIGASVNVPSVLSVNSASVATVNSASVGQLTVSVSVSLVSQIN
jgi:hypothetical protein